MRFPTEITVYLGNDRLTRQVNGYYESLIGFIVGLADRSVFCSDNLE